MWLSESMLGYANIYLYPEVTPNKISSLGHDIYTLKVINFLIELID